MSLTLGIPTSNGNFRLVCVECRQEIPGTVSLATAADAGRKMASKGGVKCPQCRAKSCPRCGSGKVSLTASPERPNQTLCTICHLETGKIAEVVLV